MLKFTQKTNAIENLILLSNLFIILRYFRNFFLTNFLRSIVNQDEKKLIEKKI